MKVNVRASLAGAALLAAALVVPGAQAGTPTKAGTLDPTFSPDAPAGLTTFVPSRQYVDVAVQQDGKVVAVSDIGGDFYVARYNPDGSPDTSFAGTGTGFRTVDVGAAGQPDAALAVAVDAQNRIVVAGSGGATPSDFAMVRLSPDGGTVQLNTHTHVANPAHPEAARDVAFQSDGTIVLAGVSQSGGSPAYKSMTALRLSPSTGATIGPPVVRGTVGDAEAFGVAVYPSGPHQDRFVLVGAIAGAGANDLAVTRLEADSDIDYSFNGGTIERIDLGAGSEYGAGVAALASGGIVVAGNNGTGDLFAARLEDYGPLDDSFNVNGVRFLDSGGGDVARNHPLAVQPDGKVVVTGDVNNLLDAGVFRVNTDGSPDAGFGTGGLAVLDASGNDEGNAVALDAQGRIMLAGDTGASAGFLAGFIGLTDSDGDGVPDASDACPAVPGTAPNGCVPPPPSTPAPEAVLKGKKVVLDTVLAKKATAAKCPARAEVSVKSKGIKVTKRLQTTTVPGGCLVKGKVRLPAKPKKTAAVKVKVSAKGLVTKRLVAVRP